MSSSFEYLLSLDPLQALVRMVNDLNGTNFHLNGFTASLPTQIGLTATQVTLTGKPKANSFDDETVQGSFTVTYDRLDLNIFLQNIALSYNPTLPISTQNVLNAITDLIGQKFYIDDIVLEEVTRDNGAMYALKAKPESLRFVGQVVFPLITLTMMTDIMDPNAIASETDTSQVIFPLASSVPYLNATDFRSIAGEFSPGDLAQNKADLVTLFNNVVPDPSTSDDFSVAPWYVNVTPGPFNLYNSVVVGYTSGIGVNPGIPTLEKALVVRVNGNYCTNFQTGLVTIPYTAQDFELDGYTALPRCTANSIVSLSNGTAWNVYLNSFQVDQVITSFQTTPPVLMDGPNPWVAIQGLPTPTNLYGAKVLYNGQVRPTDLPAATQGLDRVLVVDMGPDNSIWQGPYSFYYASPIPMTWQGYPTLKGVVGSAFHHDFMPSGGSGPFTYAITGGTLPPNTTFSGSALDGNLVTAGSYQFDLTITDANGTAVVFNVTVVVGTEIQPLNITGTLANAVTNQAYTGFLSITGGLQPYSALGLISGQLPPGLSISLEYNSILVSGTPTTADTYPFSISVSSADGQQVSASFSLTVSDTYQQLAITGNYSAGVVGTQYSSSLFLSGGSGVYNPPSVISGSLPPGLSLSLSTVGAPQVMLEGTPTTAGTYAFTVQVYSSDNQFVTSDQTVVVVTG